ncbi:MAG: hypothetical protein ACTSXJ_11185 [Candidatus Baldrarchaeia archaeon]
MSYAEVRVPRKILPMVVRALEDSLRRLAMEISATEEKIRKYESKYGMSSREFMEKYRQGLLGDNEDYMAWYGELVFLEKAKEEYEELRKVIRDSIRGVRGKS